MTAATGSEPSPESSSGSHRVPGAPSEDGAAASVPLDGGEGGAMSGRAPPSPPIPAAAQVTMAGAVAVAGARPVSLPQTPPPTSHAVPTAPVQAVAVAVAVAVASSSSSSPPGSPPRSGSGSGRRLLLQDRGSAQPQYPAGIPRHRSDRVLLPSPLPSPSRGGGGGASVATAATATAAAAAARPPGGGAAICAAATALDQKGDGPSRASLEHDDDDDDDGHGHEHDDDDLVGEHGRHHREEETMNRLVEMAKRQQSFAALWFAASHGAAGMQLPRFALPAGSPPPRPPPSPPPPPPPAPPPPSRQPPQQDERGSRRVAVTLREGIGRAGPIDVDSEEVWQEDASGSSEGSSSTPRICNVSPNCRAFTPRLLPPVPVDAARGKAGGSGFWTREVNLGPCHLASANFAIVLLLLVVVAGASIVAVVSSAGDPSSQGGAATVQEGQPFAGLLDGDREEKHASAMPSMVGDQWQGTPRHERIPSLAPSSEPSAPHLTSVPSQPPTPTKDPTTSPTHHPTSEYQTTSYIQIGDDLAGQEPSSQFGYTVALSADGTVMAVGSRYENDRAGSVRLYVLSSPPKKKGKGKDVDADDAKLRNGSWNQIGQTVRGRFQGDQFGFSVSLSHDGLTLAASEPGYDGPMGDRSGNVRIFRYDSYEPKPYGTGGVWRKIGDISGEGAMDLFGASVSLSGDGTRLAAGAPYHDLHGTEEFDSSRSKVGRVRAFNFEKEMVWNDLGEPLDGSNAGDWFGWSVCMSAAGNTIASGAIHDRIGGYVRVYELNDDDGSWMWSQSGPDIRNPLLEKEATRADHRFGHAVALNSDGNRLVAGSPYSDPNSIYNAGIAVVFERTYADTNDVLWATVGDPIVGAAIEAHLGWDVDIALDGSHILIGAPGVDANGLTAVCRWNEGPQTWGCSHSNSGKRENDGFGFSLAMNGDGGIYGAGAPGQGTNYRGYATVYQHASDAYY